MAKPFLLLLRATLTGSGTGTVSYTVPPGQTLTLNKIFQKSTGAFNITDINDATGHKYSNASNSNPIDSDMIRDVADGYNGLSEFPVPIVLGGGTQIQFNLTDTSTSSNTVQLMLAGKLDSG